MKERFLELFNTNNVDFENRMISTNVMPIYLPTQKKTHADVQSCMQAHMYMLFIKITNISHILAL